MIKRSSRDFPNLSNFNTNRWRFGHGINTQKKLEDFMDSGFDVAEGDLSWGKYHPTNHEDLIMAHPPTRISDLSFKEFVAAALGRRHGLKVDFKEPGTLAEAVKILKDQAFPEPSLILNMDAVHGPGGSKPLFTTTHLQKLRKEFPNAVISIGATLGKDTAPLYPSHLKEFTAAAEAIGGHTTLCFRADMLFVDFPILQTLVKERHITVFNSLPRTPAAARTLTLCRRLIKRGYFDLIDEQGQAIA